MREGAASAATGPSSEPAALTTGDPASPLAEARENIKKDLAFIPLCASLVAAREFNAALEMKATISLVADGTVSAAEFFGTNPFTGARESMFSHLGEMLDSPDRPNFDGTEVQQFAADIACFRALMAACKDERAHPEIQNEARSYEPTVPGYFTLRAASLQPEHHAESIKLVEPMLDALLQTAAQGKAEIDDVMQDLDRVFTNRLHPDARKTIASYRHKFMALMPASTQKVDTAVDLVCSAGLLPERHQQGFVRAALQTIAEMPNSALSHQAQVDTEFHPFTECAYGLSGLHDNVFGKSAIDLLEATSGVAEELHLEQEVCKLIGQFALMERPATGQNRFASLPDEDKVHLFLAMLDASLSYSMYQMGGARHWGPKMVPHLPQSVRQQATDLLNLANQGSSPMLGFRLAAKNWQW